ncbi:dual specificity protein phosphatase family protein [Numidum massiliense]|uniref:dual specificity protein phosphatase family protein n=1 Tax=Numidum massiliense TaxID=1522315 RepID=UPI0006D5421E|nr:dual specificity protein phosphatase family protein [Numidum massiliense]
MRIVEMIPHALYAGGKIDDDKSWAFILEHMDVILNVRTAQDHPPRAIPGKLFLWAPLLDKQAPHVQWVVTLMQTMNTFFDMGYVMHVHETGGINRLGFILAAFYMQRFGWNREQALAVARAKKPDLQPKPPYMELLSQYKAYLCGPYQKG